MIKILIVDDDYEKIQLITKLIRENYRIDIDCKILDVRNIVEAKRILIKESIDLLLLDINVPIINGDAPARDGGLTLLEELSINSRLLKPKSIIGITGFDDLYDESKPTFDNVQWTILKFDRSSDEWLEKIKEKIIYLLQACSPLDEEYDIAIITALLKTELEAVLALPCNWETITLPGDPIPFYKGKIIVESRTLNIVAASALRMGMVATASLTTKITMLFKPKYIFMVGIAAGIEGKCNYGDILVADPVWDWGNGKLTLINNKPTFLAAPHQIAMDSKYRALLKEIIRTREFLDDIKSKYLSKKPTYSLDLHVGPIASGASVLEDPKISQMIKQQHRELLGVEMEIYGMMAALEYLPNPTISFAFKSVCDFANPHKNDEWQSYAAYTSATFAYNFILKYIANDFTQ